MISENDPLIGLGEIVGRRHAAYATADAAYTTERRELRKSRASVRIAREAAGIAMGVARKVQEKAHRKLADVVSLSMAAVLDSPYTFKINFVQKRGRTEAQLVFVRDGMGVHPLTASGGGVVDLAAFALRISCVLIAQPPIRRVVILDEPLSKLSETPAPKARELMDRLARELGIQIIMITHKDVYKTGHVVTI